MKNKRRRLNKNQKNLIIAMVILTLVITIVALLVAKYTDYQFIKDWDEKRAIKNLFSKKK